MRSRLEENFAWTSVHLNSRNLKVRRVAHKGLPYEIPCDFDDAQQ
jgi:hypothetical protein